MRMRGLLILTCAALALGSSRSEETADKVGSARDLVLSIELGKVKIAMYEPVTVNYSVANLTDRPIVADVEMNYGSHAITFWITSGDGERVEYFQGPLESVVRVETRFEPGMKRFSQVDLLWNSHTKSWAFSAPGRYGVDAEMKVGRGQGRATLKAAPVEIEVVEPAGEDARAIGFFKSKEDFDMLMRRGPGRYCGNRPGPSCFEELRRFLRDHSGSAYAPPITWHLAAWVESARSDVTPKSDLTDELYRSFLKSWPDHAMAPRVIYGYAFFLLRLGRESEALEITERLERDFPNRSDLAQTLRVNLQKARNKKG